MKCYCGNIFVRISIRPFSNVATTRMFPLAFCQKRFLCFKTKSNLLSYRQSEVLTLAHYIRRMHIRVLVTL